MSDVTHILNTIEQGDIRATDTLLPLIYEELRLLATKKLPQERPGQTLQALMGHASISTTMEFYLKVTEEDMQKAANALNGLLTKSDARRQFRSLTTRKCETMGDAKFLQTRKFLKIRLRGLEPLTFGSVDRRSKNTNPDRTKTCKIPKEQLTPQLTPKVPKQGEFDTSQLPSDLAEIVAAWPQLPEHIKSAIKALVDTQNSTKTQ